MANKKLYIQEDIEFQNGHSTKARPLPIGKLKIVQNIFEDYTADLQRYSSALQKANKRMQEAADKDEDIDPIVEEWRTKVKEANYITYEDALVEACAVALAHWKVYDEKRKEVAVDQDYCTENLDTATATRICEIAANIKLGELSEETAGDITEKKVNGA